MLRIERLAAVVTLVTVALMFVIGTFVVPALASWSSAAKLGSIAAAATTSFGVYGAISKFLFWLFSKSVFLRRKLLGSGFLEGTWVGFVPRPDGDLLTVEFHEQSSGYLQIRGKATFEDHDATYATWTSVASTIDYDTRKLTYVYDCDVHSRTQPHTGVAVFTLSSPQPAEAS